MEFDIASLPKSARYKILSSCVAPRPIAWVTSQSSDGLLNAAPYSFFNMMGDDPLTIVLGLMAHGEGRFKDTAENLITTREFVVNLVDEAHGEAMNITCMAAPSDIDETGCARLANGGEPDGEATAHIDECRRASSAARSGPSRPVLTRWWS